MTDGTIKATVTGGQIQDIVGAGTVNIENLIFNRPVEESAVTDVTGEPIGPCPYPGLACSHSRRYWSALKPWPVHGSTHSWIGAPTRSSRNTRIRRASSCGRKGASRIDRVNRRPYSICAAIHRCARPSSTESLRLSPIRCLSAA
jgi:hypothetical protein